MNNSKTKAHGLSPNVHKVHVWHRGGGVQEPDDMNAGFKFDR